MFAHLEGQRDRPAEAPATTERRHQASVSRCQCRPAIQAGTMRRIFP